MKTQSFGGDHKLPPVQQVKLLGTPLGHAAFVEDQLAKLSLSHNVLFEHPGCDRPSSGLVIVGMTRELLLACGVRVWCARSPNVMTQQSGGVYKGCSELNVTG